MFLESGVCDRWGKFNLNAWKNKLGAAAAPGLSRYPVSQAEAE